MSEFKLERRPVAVFLLCQSTGAHDPMPVLSVWATREAAEAEIVRIHADDDARWAAYPKPQNEWPARTEEEIEADRRMDRTDLIIVEVVIGEHREDGWN